LPLRSLASRQDDALCARLRENARTAMFAEYRRLLYVALTRAEDRLYICGAAQEEKKISEQSWYELAKAGLKDIAKTLSDGTLRLGEDRLQTLEGKNFLFSNIRHPSSDFSFLEKSPLAEPAPAKPLRPSHLQGTFPPAASP